MHGHFQVIGSPIVQIVLSSSKKVAVVNLGKPENNFHCWKYTAGDLKFKKDINLVQLLFII